MRTPDLETLATAELLSRNEDCPIEVWAVLVCEALGMDHNLPTTRAELWLASHEDVRTTRENIANLKG